MHDIVEDDTRKTVFEERIVLLRATSMDDALAQADAEAAAYCATSSTPVVYLGYAMVYQLASDTTPGDRAEVFSLMRDSSLSPTEYLDRFHDEGHERAQSTSEQV
jgi:hypothetical protein